MPDKSPYSISSFGLHNLMPHFIPKWINLHHIMSVVKGIFVICEWPYFFPVKCEMVSFFLVNCDFLSSCELRFPRRIFCENEK